jgi:hypothetical protein
MWSPSLEPGGVSSAAEAEAEAVAEAGCEESLIDGAKPTVPDGRGSLGGYCSMLELMLFREVADAEMLEACWCRVLADRAGLIVTGVLVADESSPVPGEFGMFSLSSLSVPLFLVAAPRPISKLAEPCNCSTSSSHLTLSEDDGRSARSARLRQSLVRSLSATHIWWKRNKSPSVDCMLTAVLLVFVSQRSTRAAKLRA